MNWALLRIVILFFILSSCSSRENELHIFTWGEYLDPKLIQKFERECSCKVVVDTFDSNESMYAKLKLGSADYDLIFPSNYYAEILQKQDMLQPLDYSRIPNVQNVDRKYLPPDSYSVPFMISFAGIAYRKDRISNFEPSWSMFDRKDLRGRMTLLNDVRETLGAALKFLGYSANTINEQEISQAADQLLTWKRNLAKFENEQYKNGIASAEYLLVHGYNGDLRQVIEENEQIAFVFPKEGTTISLDMMVIPKNARNPKLAEQFINFLLEGEHAAQNMVFTKFLSPNLSAYQQLSAQIRQDATLLPSKEILKKSEIIHDLGDDAKKYNRAWDRVKEEYTHTSS